MNTTKELCITFLALMSDLLHLKQIAQTADGLLDIMPVLFVPADAGLINNRNPDCCSCPFGTKLDVKQFCFFC